MRIGLVATSRSGSTYFRRVLCNTFGLYDPSSWLRENSYKNIKKENWSRQPHVLKILPHYIPENESIGDIIKELMYIMLDLVLQYPLRIWFKLFSRK